MQSMIVELQAAMSFLSHTTETFAPPISEEFGDLPMSPNDETWNQCGVKILFSIIQAHH
jgi:hypothetical protein